MDRTMAQQFVDSLARFFDVSLSAERRAYYVDNLIDVDGSLAQDAFNHLIRTARRFPPLADILDTFAALRSTTHEIERGRPTSAALKERNLAAITAALEFEPVSYHQDLYWGYVMALQEYNQGQRSRENLRHLRQTLIEQARARDAKAKSPATTVTPSRPTGIAASVPKGDD